MSLPSTVGAVTVDRVEFPHDRHTSSQHDHSCGRLQRRGGRATLFHALHKFNAALNPRFALADGWEEVLAAHLAHERTHDHGRTLIAWWDERPVGLLIMDGHTDSPLFRDRHWAEIVALYVVPKARGAGVADELVASGVEWARTHGYDRMQLYVTTSNGRAKRFYKRAGFGPVQEVWSLDVGLVSGQPSVDTSCEMAYGHGHRLLSVDRHHLTPDDEPCHDDFRQ